MGFKTDFNYALNTAVKVDQNRLMAERQPGFSGDSCRIGVWDGPDAGGGPGSQNLVEGL